MKKSVLLLAICGLSLSTYAEWYSVQSVTSYNQIVASKANTPANTIKIRIRNLENVEDIQSNRSKVLLSGQSTIQLAKDALKGQLVWIEDLMEEGDGYVADIYLSYEQMVRGYAKQRMVGGQTVSPEIKAMVQDLVNKMFSSLRDTSSIYENDAEFLSAYKRAADMVGATGTKKSYFTYDVSYTHDYLKGIFIYEALCWFKEEGQFLPAGIQDMYITWLSQYQKATDQRAKGLEMKIRDMTVRYELYKDFLFDDLAD
ncbi:MAG: hypothetical protein JXR25_08955 [Pontiellaceae bacterium]|nr:hypothetical protein [Pontiellaceae bacterium]MBN2784944.1 hypothetical protein [Pontiellaceae bacterium]